MTSLETLDPMAHAATSHAEANVIRHFRPELLEPPQSFYARELDGKLSRPNRAGWTGAPCPFHHSQNNGRKKSTAFGVRLDSGGFKCLSCDAKGGSIVDFIMLRDGLSFKDAAIKLGAWDVAPSPEVVRRLAAQDRERKERNLAEQRAEAKQHRELMEIRDHLHLAMQFQREAASRLEELAAGAEPVTANEENDCWEIMSLALDYERRIAYEYRTAAGREVMHGE